MLNVSIVLYNHPLHQTKELIQAIRKSEVVNQLYIIDNSPHAQCEYKEAGLNYFFTGRNLGYGAGHNIALRKTLKNDVPYHLIVNPDIELKTEILSELCRYMDENQDVGHIMPKVFYPNGEVQYLCKLLPTPMDLLFRRFLPASISKKRIDKFEMRDSGYDKIMDVPYLSGCCMFLRTEALKKVGLFDERFFLYPEDIDLTRRIHAHYRTIFYPYVSVIHHHERSSYKSFKMMLIHAWNMIKYFNKWGWIWDSTRKPNQQQVTSNQ